MRKNRVKIAITLLFCFCVSSIVGFGCSSSSDGGNVARNEGAFDNPVGFGSQLNATEEDFCATPELMSEDTYDADGGITESEGADNNGNTLDTGVIDTEKLIYSGSIAIDTLNFDSTVKEFKSIIGDVDGFLEYETIYDNNGGQYVYDDFASYNSGSEESRRTYTATVRVPSDKYDKFLNMSDDIGDIRSQSSHVQNISQEYSTAQTQLEIYQTKYDRYKELMKQASTVEEMMSIEHEITEIELRLAEYKTTISVMDTDVAYSTMDVTINEILKRSDINNKNTFFVRLKETAIESWEGVLDFLEWLLFFIIRYWWYAVFALIIIKLNKKFKIVKGIKFHKPRFLHRKRKKDINEEVFENNVDSDVKTEDK